MNYHARYGLEFNPFIKNSKDIVVESSEYKEVQYRLNYLLNNKGIGLVTGMPGKGKTTALRLWSKGLNPSLYKVIYLSLSTLTVIEFYKELADSFGIEVMFRKRDNFKNIRSAIERMTQEKHITPVIILDEANYINNGILNDLKMLFAFDMDSRDRTIVLLVGLPQLNNTMKLTINEPLKQRITMNYEMEGLSKEESKNYILGKIKGAGGTQAIFDDNALQAVINAGNGTPRLINKICNACLLVGESKKAESIDTDLVMMAVNDLELG